MTKHYFTAIFVSGFSGRAVLQFTEPDGSTVVREDVRDTEDMQDWWTSLDSEIEIEHKQLSQSDIMLALGISQERTADLINRKIGSFSSDQLIAYLAILGF